MTEKELLYYIALQKAKGIGAVNARRLIQQAGTAEAVFKLSPKDMMRTYGVGTFIVNALKDKSIFREAEKEIEHILYHKISYTGLFDPEYPKRLSYCNDAPIVLFSKGNIVWDERPVISIVGTRKMTPYGKAFIEEFMKGIAGYNPIIVSGFAYGVDITAHLEALKHGLQTVAVMAHGIGRTYPYAHKRYVDEVMLNGGFYTEFHHDAKPLREHFLERNRIVAGLSDALIVVESGVKGGALITADLAQSYGREVFAVPGRVKDVWSAGCNRLIRNNKAAILNSAEDLIYYLNWKNSSVSNRPQTIQTRLFIELEGDEKIIFEYLKDKGKTLLDTLSVDTGIPVFRLSSLLLNLELQGVVRPLPGKMFEITA
jgi:DNA processing protein